MSGSLFLSMRLIPGCAEPPLNIKTKQPEISFYIRERRGPGKYGGGGGRDNTRQVACWVVLVVGSPTSSSSPASSCNVLRFRV